MRQSFFDNAFFRLFTVQDFQTEGGESEYLVGYNDMTSIRCDSLGILGLVCSFIDSWISKAER